MGSLRPSIVVAWWPPPEVLTHLELLCARPDASPPPQGTSPPSEAPTWNC